MILKTPHLLSGAIALSILTTTTGLWAQSTATAMPAPAAPTANTAAGPSSTKSLTEAFDQADANKDLKLTREEAKEVPGLSGSFAAIDINKDGAVSKDEFAKAIQ